ncbi:MAG TPA: RNA methyltransferase [Salinimicrobium sp.]|nr:RNA methyltransferase [Salinimicrobium sp.]
MSGKSQFKLITSLAQKKYRARHQLFVAEGRKTINELLNSSFELLSLYTTEPVFEAEEEKTIFLTEKELKKISRLHTPQTALAVFHIPQDEVPEISGLVLALDGVRDPGNLGTIIRLCDWFGINQLVCSEDCVDCYNPKVVQATMGSIARVRINYLYLASFLEKNRSKTAVFGAFMEGENVYQQELNSQAILVMGNEANGIRPEIEALAQKKIKIPQFGETLKTESLNVASATAVLLSEFRRRG